MTPEERMSAHEEHCEIRYREIQRQLDQHEKRFDYRTIYFSSWLCFCSFCTFVKWLIETNYASTHNNKHSCKHSCKHWV